MDGKFLQAGGQEEDKALKHELRIVKGRRSGGNWIGGTSFQTIRVLMSK